MEVTKEVRRLHKLQEQTQSTVQQLQDQGVAVGKGLAIQACSMLHVAIQASFGY